MAVVGSFVYMYIYSMCGDWFRNCGLAAAVVLLVGVFVQFFLVAWSWRTCSIVANFLLTVVRRNTVLARQCRHISSPHGNGFARHDDAVGTEELFRIFGQNGHCTTIFVVFVLFRKGIAGTVHAEIFEIRHEIEQRC